MVPKEARPRGDVTEDLATKGARFDVETAEGSFTILLPALEPDTSEPEG